MPSSAYRVEGTDAPTATGHRPAATRPEPATGRRSEPAPAAGSASPRPHRLWDIALSTVLLVGGAAAAGFGSVLALFLAFASDSCGAGCSITQMEVGMWTAILAPWVAWLAGVVVVILLLVRRRIAFWVPFAGLAAGVLGWLLGAWLVGAALG